MSPTSSTRWIPFNVYPWFCYLQKQFWEIVSSRSRHVAIHGGHVDTKTQTCSLFPVKKENQYSRWGPGIAPLHTCSSNKLDYCHQCDKKKKTSQWRIQQNCWFVNSNKGKFQIKLFTLIFTLVGIPGIWTSSHSILCLCWSTLDLYQVCCGFGFFFKHLFQARLVLLAQESRTILGMSWHVLPVQY